jgi:hypothetical protein
MFYHAFPLFPWYSLQALKLARNAAFTLQLAKDKISSKIADQFHKQVLEL